MCRLPGAGGSAGPRHVLRPPVPASRRSVREVPPPALRLSLVPLYVRPRRSERAAYTLDTPTAFVYSPRAAANSCSRCSLVTTLVQLFSKCQIITELVCPVLCLCVYSVFMGCVARP